MLAMFNENPTTMTEVRRQWAGCDKCYFSSMWKETGPCRPAEVNGERDIYLLGQWPGEKDMLNGIPYSGKQGLVTRRMFTDAGFNINKMFLDNTLLCACPVAPTTAIINNCAPHTDQCLDIIRPKLIIAMGDLAVRRLKIKGLAGNRKQTFTYRTYPVVPMIHTASIDRQKDPSDREQLKQEVISDIEFALIIYNRITSNVTG